jgi:beta-glucosidase-like glycosyl hydrolase
MVRIICLCLLAISPLQSQSFDPEKLSIEDKVPMLFMIADYGDEALVLQEGAGKSLGEVTEHVDRLVSQKKIGGILFKGRWTPTGLKERIRHLKSISTMPLLFAQDLEWGPSMRHDGVIEFPKALCVGAITDDALVQAWAHAIAATAKDIGINLFLGPVADVNTNPKNPVIHDRSFGDNPQEVARKVCIMIRALQEHGIASCVKHFPGHGNTSKDSHTDLPVIQSSMSQLEKIELLPFKEAIGCGVDCVMTAHIALPNTESGKHPASLSSFWCKKVLRDDLKFQESGVVITDDLIMAGALGNTTCIEAAERAVMAGNDLCIISKNFEECFEAIVRSVNTKKIHEKDIDTHVRRVFHLQTKYHHHTDAAATSLTNMLLLTNTLYKNALTNIGESFSFSPESTLVLQIGSIPLCPLLRKLVFAYPHFSIAMMRKNPRKEEVDGIIHELTKKKEILIVLCDLERSPTHSFGLTSEVIQSLQRIHETGCVMRYVLFGSPYVIPLLPQPVSSALIAYEKTEGSGKAVLQTLCGTFKPIGKLPVKLDIVE